METQPSETGLPKWDAAPQILASYNLCSSTGAVRTHCGSLQHLVWLGLQWNSMSVLFPLRKLLERLFHLPQETSRLETDAPESICLLDLETRLGTKTEAACPAWLKYSASPGEARPSACLNDTLGKKPAKNSKFRLFV
ncbi:hypothetical protein CIB84_017423, partial [Bambusicola thoracicus]